MLHSLAGLTQTPFVPRPSHGLANAGGRQLRNHAEIGLQHSWNVRRQLSIQEYLGHPAVSFARGEAGYKPGNKRH